MRDLHKKISVVLLSGGLLVGGVSSNESISYASSNGPLRNFEIEGSININEYDKIKSASDVRYGAEKYGYLIYIYDVDGYKEDRISDFNNRSRLDLLLDDYPDLKYPSKYFKSGLYFQKYISKYGLEKGFQSFWIGGIKYILIVPHNIKPGISHSNVKP